MASSYYLPSQAGSSSSALNPELSKHLDHIFASFAAPPPLPLAMDEDMIPPPEEALSEYDSDVDDDRSDAGMGEDGVEYTFADVDDVREQEMHQVEDDTWLASTAAAPVPELEPTRKQDDDDEDEEMMDDSGATPRQSQHAQPPPPSFLLEEFGLDINGQFDGFDLAEKPRPADYVQGSVALPPPTATSPSAAAMMAGEPSFWDYGMMDDAKLLQGLMGVGGSGTAAGVDQEDKAAKAKEAEGAWWTDDLASSDLSSSFAAWCGSVAVHDPTSSTGGQLVPPASFVSSSTRAPAATGPAMMPGWLLADPSAGLALPQSTLYAAPPSAFSFAPSSSSSSGASFATSSTVSETSSEEPRPHSSSTASSSTRPTSTPSITSPPITTLSAPANPPSSASANYTAARLAAIAAAARSSLEKPTGRKSSHHGKKTALGAARQSKPASSATKKKAAAPKAKAPYVPKPRPGPSKAALKAVAEEEGDMEDEDEIEDGKGKGHKYVCGHCGKTFSRPYNLKVHKETHKGVKKHSCPLPGCSKAFSRRHDLTRHLEAYHEPWLVALDVTPQEASADGFAPPVY